MGRIRNTLRSFALIWQRFMLNSIGGVSLPTRAQDAHLSEIWKQNRSWGDNLSTVFYWWWQVNSWQEYVYQCGVFF